MISRSKARRQVNSRRGFAYAAFLVCNGDDPGQIVPSNVRNVSKSSRSCKMFHVEHCIDGKSPVDFPVVPTWNTRWYVLHGDSPLQSTENLVGVHARCSYPCVPRGTLRSLPIVFTSLAVVASGGSLSESVLSVPTELTSLEVTYFPQGPAKVQRHKPYTGLSRRVNCRLLFHVEHS